MLIRNKYQRCRVTDSRFVAEILQNILRAEKIVDREKEHFWSVGLCPSNTIQYIDLVSLGTLDSGVVHPRETYRLAVMRGASKIITAHNHPSGNPKPSEFDLKTIRRLIDAGNILGIKMLDHIIVTEKAYSSLCGKKFLYQRTAGRKKTKTF